MLTGKLVWNFNKTHFALVTKEEENLIYLYWHGLFEETTPYPKSANIEILTFYNSLRFDVYNMRRPFNLRLQKSFKLLAINNNYLNYIHFSPFKEKIHIENIL